MKHIFQVVTNKGGPDVTNKQKLKKMKKLDLKRKSLRLNYNLAFNY